MNIARVHSCRKLDCLSQFRNLRMKLRSCAQNISTVWRPVGRGRTRNLSFLRWMNVVKFQYCQCFRANCIFTIGESWAFLTENFTDFSADLKQKWDTFSVLKVTFFICLLKLRILKLLITFWISRCVPIRKFYQTTNEFTFEAATSRSTFPIDLLHFAAGAAAGTLRAQFEGFPGPRPLGQKKGVEKKGSVFCGMERGGDEAESHLWKTQVCHFRGGAAPQWTGGGATERVTFLWCSHLAANFTR